MSSDEGRASTNKRSMDSEESKQEEEDDYMTMLLPNENAVVEPSKPKTKLRKVDSKQQEASEILPKGFAMMSKMGFNIGETLGRNTEKGLKNPIWVARRDTPIGANTLHQPLSLNRKENAADEEGYQRWIQEKRQRTTEMRTLHAMQKKAFELSGDVDVFDIKSDPRDYNCLWRRYVMELQEKLRSKEQNTELRSEDSDSAKSDDIDDELVIFEELSPVQQIRGVHVHMRTEFFYCFYCGAQFTTEEELLQKCPGPTEDDHY
ncbi:Cmg1p LALA0_S10e05204g [Lachancea lanzarotensis]|uniref:LALA0S10e05204g1_1 n=1 Tax=Lachancea lanzarotensis TaxID=1245769 RepID=A0A0C7NCV9_9SACH|nr:uncharacterized protein LALA0_S10e05204g [Lachancea lanzarotensis]CEP64218.1 LALA0S10e05204g1_1 [Lachancea lanzarotensis]